MSSTEIDEIFASRSKFSQVEITSSPKQKGKAKATLCPNEDTSMSGKRKKKKKIKSTMNEDDLPKPSLARDVTSVKRKYVEPETIIDPSAYVQTMEKKKNPGGAVVEKTSSQIAKRKKTRHDDFEKFRDSRGIGPRKKTEEGFSIYKEDELGIGDKGGDTPLCPFDCDCCF